MINDKLFGQAITEAYAHMIKVEMQKQYPDFYFEKGAIIYDYDTESYVCVGFSDEEKHILEDIAKNIARN